MGRPKAVRNRDVVGIIEAKQGGKHTSFDDNMADDAAVVAHAIKESEIINQTIGTDSDVPEEIANNDAEILKLKQIHEQLVKPTKKRKPRTSKESIESLADKEIDVSALLSSGTEQADTTVAPATKKKTIKRNNLREVGKLQFVIDTNQSDPLENFKFSSEALDFRNQMFGHRERINYATFMTQKRSGPSKQFIVKTNA